MRWRRLPLPNTSSRETALVLADDADHDAARVCHADSSFYLFSRILNWVNTYKVLIIPGVVDAYGIFLLTQYMKGIPSELLDAAGSMGPGRCESSGK
jgi:hypothetical protein